MAALMTAYVDCGSATFLFIPDATRESLVTFSRCGILARFPQAVFCRAIHNLLMQGDAGFIQLCSI